MFGIELSEILSSGGLLIIALILFAETGLLIGFFLPGDTLLLAAGILAAAGTFSLWTLLPVVITSTILGNVVGYQIGKHAGPRLFKKEDGFLFRKEYIEKAETFYEKHGSKTIFLARFIPIVRTFAPIVAGVAKMDERVFTFYNITGGIFWGTSVTLLGYFFGSKIPHLDNYILPVILVIMLVSVASPFVHAYIDKQKLKK